MAEQTFDLEGCLLEISALAEALFSLAYTDMYGTSQDEARAQLSLMVGRHVAQLKLNLLEKGKSHG
jgi:hypothetical protein